MARVGSQAKKEQIKQSLKATRAKRQNQSCKVYEFKLSKRAFNRKTREYLTLVFLQAKWFVNYAIAQANIFEVDTRIKSVPVKVSKQFEERGLTLLSSQMKQALLDRLQANVRSLATKKKQGEKIGKLRFRAIIGSIPLKQYNNTYFFPQLYNRIRKGIF